MRTQVTDVPGTLVHAAVPGSRPITVDDLWAIPRVGGPLPAPRGDAIVAPITTYSEEFPDGVTCLWRIDGDEPRPLTGTDVTAGAADWSPDGTRLAVLLKPAGETDVKPQVHVVDLDGGVSEALTDLPLGVLDVRWRPDDGGFVIAAKLIRGHGTVEATKAETERREDDPCKVHATEDRVYRFWDQWLTGGEEPHLFTLDVNGGGLRDLTPDGAGWFDFMEPRGQFDVAPDCSEVAWGGLMPDADRDEITMRLFTVPMDGGASRCITADTPTYAMRPRYTPDGAAIVYGRGEDRYFYADRARIYRFDRRGGTHTPWCIDWDQAPSGWELASDGTLVFTAERAARVDVYALAPDANEPRCVASGGSFGSPRTTAGGDVLFTAQTIQAPTEVYRCPLGGGTPQRVTTFTAEALDGIAFGEVREMTVTGAGGEPVQSFLVLPPDHDPATRPPLVNIVHGGPHGTSGDNFHYRWNPHIFAAPGYVTVMPNFQGSTSWGTDYAQRIQGGWGDRPYTDVMAVTDSLVESGLVDETRMAAVGASYGGYMMAWIAGHTDRFRCIINHAGVYNTLSMFATDYTAGRHRAFGGEPWDGLDAIDRYNPARFTANMRTPMLIIHGEKDYRVPVTQGLECYGVLKSKGVPARLLYFPDENHWVLKPHNSRRWHAEVHDWLARWLIQGQAPYY